MSTVAVHKLSADEFYTVASRLGRCELVRGEVVRLSPSGGEHGVIAARIGAELLLHVRAHHLGYVFGAETGFVVATNPDTVRAPDAAFLSHARLGRDPLPKRFVPFAPDLAVEVVSPDDRPRQVQEKVDTWLGAGTRRVWVLYPRSATVHVHDAAGDLRVLVSGDLLTDDEVLPGFSCPVAALFE